MKSKSKKKLLQAYDWANDLSVEQIKRIQEGLADIKAGRIVTSEKVWAKYGRKI